MWALASWALASVYQPRYHSRSAARLEGQNALNRRSLGKRLQHSPQVVGRRDRHVIATRGEEKCAWVDVRATDIHSFKVASRIGVRLVHAAEASVLFP